VVSSSSGNHFLMETRLPPLRIMGQEWRAEHPHLLLLLLLHRLQLFNSGSLT